MKYLLTAYLMFFSLGSHSYENQNWNPEETNADYPPWQNIHTVEEGQLYRSATLKPNALENLIQKKDIKTIINLRGESSSEWYQKEVEVVQKTGITLENIQMRASRLPLRKDLLKLIELFETAERPILIHCQAGADRTGEAAAMWVIDQMDGDQEDGLEQLTLKYKHLRWAKPAKSYFIKNIYQNSKWALENYFPCQSEWSYFDKEELCSGDKESESF